MTAEPELAAYHQGHKSEAVDLNPILSPSCLDTEVQIAWDQWARVRVFCMHGTAEGVSGSLCLNESFQQAIKSWQAMNHDAHVCYQDCPPPASYIEDDPEYWGNTTSECELMRGHDGECKHFDDPDDLDAYRYERLVYFKNGHDRTGTPVFGDTVIPHPYRATS